MRYIQPALAIRQMQPAMACNRAHQVHTRTAAGHHAQLTKHVAAVVDIQWGNEQPEFRILF